MQIKSPNGFLITRIKELPKNPINSHLLRFIKTAKILIMSLSIFIQML
jgi:hypothetical protein